MIGLGILFIVAGIITFLFIAYGKTTEKDPLI
jgi:hypothetical protein